MERFHNLGLIETNKDRFLVIKENQLTARSDRLKRLNYFKHERRLCYDARKSMGLE